MLVAAPAGMVGLCASPCIVTMVPRCENRPFHTWSTRCREGRSKCSAQFRRSIAPVLPMVTSTVAPSCHSLRTRYDTTQPDAAAAVAATGADAAGAGGWAAADAGG